MGDKNRNCWNPDAHVTPSAPPLSALYETVPTSTSNTDVQFSDGWYLNGHASSASKHSVQTTNLTPPPDAVDDEPEPTAPPLEHMDKVPGYEGASFEAKLTHELIHSDCSQVNITTLNGDKRRRTAFLTFNVCVDIPPPLMPAVQKTEDESHRSPLPSIPHYTEKEVRQALLHEVSSHCCYGTGAVRDMAITEIKHSIAFHYTLETFAEKRTTCWAFEPHLGGAIDDKKIDRVPYPWDIPASAPEYFKNNVVQLEVPHTASIKTCHVCGGVGRKRCSTCSGNGWEYCFSCHGDGHKASALESENGRCIQCHGTGRRRCWKCNGDGMAPCKSCSATGQIKCFIRLTITWTNHMDDHVVEKVAALKADRIRSVTGEVICEEEDAVLWPLTHFPDTTVSMASAQLIQQHATSFASEKVLKQRHRVSIVPVAAISYKWKNKEGLFHVYGYEQKVHAPDYPQNCCCCVIL